MKYSNLFLERVIILNILVAEINWRLKRNEYLCINKCVMRQWQPLITTAAPEFIGRVFFSDQTHNRLHRDSKLKFSRQFPNNVFSLNRCARSPAFAPLQVIFLQSYSMAVIKNYYHYNSICASEHFIGASAGSTSVALLFQPQYGIFQAHI